MAGRGEPGGISGFLDLIDAHRGALEYDWRVRFRMALDAVPGEMGWGEAVRLFRILRADPASMLTAAIEGWEYPVSREALIAMDQYDLSYAATGAKNRKPYKRPFKVAGDDTQRGKALPLREALERLRRDFGRAPN